MREIRGMLSILRTFDLAVCPNSVNYPGQDHSSHDALNDVAIEPRPALTISSTQIVLLAGQAHSATFSLITLLRATRARRNNSIPEWTHSSARLEHLPHMQGVPGSNPGASTNQTQHFFAIARLVILRLCPILCPPVIRSGTKPFPQQYVRGLKWRPA